MLVRINGAGATHVLLDRLVGQRLCSSVGSGLATNADKLPALTGKDVRQVAYDSDGTVRDGAWVAELTGVMDLTGWPQGLRLTGHKNARTPARSYLTRDRDE